MTLGWGWDEALDTQANYGNPNSWTIRSVSTPWARSGTELGRRPGR